MLPNHEGRCLGGRQSQVNPGLRCPWGLRGHSLVLWQMPASWAAGGTEWAIFRQGGWLSCKQGTCVCSGKSALDNLPHSSRIGQPQSIGMSMGCFFWALLYPSTGPLAVGPQNQCTYHSELLWQHVVVLAEVWDCERVSQSCLKSRKVGCLWPGCPLLQR